MNELSLWIDDGSPEQPDGGELLRAMADRQGDKPLGNDPVRIHVDISAYEQFALCNLCDPHIGSYGTDYKRLLSDVDKILHTPGLFLYLGGDLYDNFILQKLIAAADYSAMRVKHQMKAASYLMEYLQEKIVAAGTGNHEAWTVQLAMVDVYRELCRQHGIAYTEHDGIIELHTGDGRSYKIFRRHKYRYNSSINWINGLQRMYDFGPEPVDVIWQEHHHDPNIATFSRHNKKVVAIKGGTYKLRDEYARMQGFYAVGAHLPTVVFSGKQWSQPVPFLEIDHAIRYLHV